MDVGILVVLFVDRMMESAEVLDDVCLLAAASAAGSAVT